eukprot:Skav229022  [mRNA]  locus=scaffold127:559076:561053:- [translate_table: standard]
MRSAEPAEAKDAKDAKEVKEALETDTTKEAPKKKAAPEEKKKEAKPAPKKQDKIGQIEEFSGIHFQFFAHHAFVFDAQEEKLKDVARHSMALISSLVKTCVGLQRCLVKYEMQYIRAWEIEEKRRQREIADLEARRSRFQKD